MNQKAIQNKSISELITECMSQMRDRECCPDKLELGTASFVRFNPNGGRKKPCFYKADTWVDHLGRDHLSCVYGSWEGGMEAHTFQESTNASTLTEQDKTRIEKEKLEWQKKIKLLQKEERIKKIKEINTTWKALETRPNDTYFDDSYFKRKRVEGYGLRYGFDDYGNYAAVMPLKNTDGTITGLQYIYKDGKKIIHGVKKGSFHMLGEIRDASTGDTIYVVEGYATGASIFKVSHALTCIACDCHNLDAVISKLTMRYKDLIIVIAADDDTTKNGVARADNPGRECAERAVEKYDCKAIYPFFDGEETGSDFNDLMIECGDSALVSQLNDKSFEIKFCVYKDLVKMKLPEPIYFLYPWLCTDSMVLLYGYRGLGKTFFALTIAYALAVGEDVFGWKSAKAVKVLYVDGEMPLFRIQERLKLISDMFCEKRLTENLAFMNMGLQEARLPSITDPEGQKVVIRNARAFNADIVIFDNISSLTSSREKENDASFWAPIQELGLRLKHLGILPMFVHHTGKLPPKGVSFNADKMKSPRGSSKLEDVLDVSIGLFPMEETSPVDGAAFEVHFMKSRNFYGEDAEPFVLELKKDSKGSLKWIRSALFIPDANQIEEESKGNPLKGMGDEILRLHKEELSPRAIVKRIKKDHGVTVSRSSIQRFLKKTSDENEGNAGLNYLEKETGLDKD